MIAHYLKCAYPGYTYVMGGANEFSTSWVSKITSREGLESKRYDSKRKVTLFGEGSQRKRRPRFCKFWVRAISTLVIFVLRFFSQLRCHDRSRIYDYARAMVQVGYITRFGLYVIYTASGLWPSVCKSRRDLHLVIYLYVHTQRYLYKNKYHEYSYTCRHVHVHVWFTACTWYISHN